MLDKSVIESVTKRILNKQYNRTLEMQGKTRKSQSEDSGNIFFYIHRDIEFKEKIGSGTKVGERLC